MTKPLAKSLHTVTVLVRVAQVFHKPGDPAWNADDALKSALDILGYAGADDPYNLVAAARRQFDA